MRTFGLVIMKQASWWYSRPHF